MNRFFSIQTGLIALLSFFLYSSQLFAKTIVISDIDDTLKKANSMGKPAEEAYHFLKKIPYLEMRDLFNEIKLNELKHNESVEYYYVSAAVDLTFNAQKWLVKNNFPIGRSTLKTIKTKQSTYEFKYAVIKQIIQQVQKNIDVIEGENLHILMFGDNAQADALVYSDLSKELNLETQIFIRDVRAEATFFDSSIAVKRIPGIKYYFSEVELFNYPEFSFISDDLKKQSLVDYQQRVLIPAYTFKTLERRLEAITNDKKRASREAQKFWNDYYTRF